MSPDQWTYFDRLGREVLSIARVYQQTGTMLRWSASGIRYDVLGRGREQSVPYFTTNPETTTPGTPAPGNGIVWGTVSYDAIGRTKASTVPDEAGANLSTATFDRLNTTSKNARHNESTAKSNATGELRQAVDANGTEINFSRDAVGSLIVVNREDRFAGSLQSTISTTLSYDRLGRKIGMVDPDKGSWEYGYNALGKLILQRDGKCQTADLRYDALGRLIERRETRADYDDPTQVNARQISTRRACGPGELLIPEATATWEYDTAALPEFPGLNLNRQANGALHKAVKGVGTPSYFEQRQQFDVNGRPTKAITLLSETGPTSGTSTYAARVEYDANGRAYRGFDADTVPEPTVGTETSYSSDGFAIEARELPSKQVLNELIGLSARGQVARERVHDMSELVTARLYQTNSGRLVSLKTGTDVIGERESPQDRQRKQLDSSLWGTLKNLLREPIAALLCARNP